MGYKSSVFYGAEIDPPTESQLQNSRTGLHGALYPFNKTQELRIALALTRTGEVDPETFYHINALRRWRRERLCNLDFAVGSDERAHPGAGSSQPQDPEEAEH